MRARPHVSRWGWVGVAAFALTVSSAVAAPLKFLESEMEPLAWGDLDGWSADDHEAALGAFRQSCRAIINGRRPIHAKHSLFRPLKSICVRAVKTFPADADEARAFFEQNFRPVRVSKLGEAEGFLTGYYEPIAEGARLPSADYSVPMYRRPRDLAAAKPIRRGEGFPNKGRIGRKMARRIVDYFDRAAIEDGALKGRNLEICYLKDPIDAFFIHIQGSARVRLEDGSMLRINYDAHNGHPYTPVGRILIDRKEVTKEEMSMERIRQWMLANPESGRELRRQNRSFIFFRVTRLSDHDEAVGAQGVPLTPGRSIAVDKALHAYGTPFWIASHLPIADENDATPFRRLTIAQDTGSAIVGLARADIYFGAGEEAGRAAGRIRHPGRFVMLVPVEVDPAKAAEKVPLPRPRPATARAEHASPSSTAHVQR